MNKNFITIDISELLMNEIISDMDALQTKMDFLVKIHDKPFNKVTMGPRRQGYVRAVLNGIKAHADSLPEAADIEGFEKDMDAENKLSKLKLKFKTMFIAGLELTHNIIKRQLMKRSNNGYALLKVINKMEFTAKPSLDNIARTSPHKRSTPLTQISYFAAGEEKYIDGIASGSSFRNTGDTVLQVSPGPDASANDKFDKFLSMPGSSNKLPKKNNKIYVKNISKDMQGICKVKINQGSLPSI
jgi:hypothetical protein